MNLPGLLEGLSAIYRMGVLINNKGILWQGGRGHSSVRRGIVAVANISSVIRLQRS